MKMITRASKCIELRRELALRRSVFPRWVKEGRITEREASERIAIMEAILADYEDFTPDLFGGDKNKNNVRAFSLQAGAESVPGMKP